MAVRLPDFQTLGISNVNPGDIRPTYSGADPVAAAQAQLGQGQQRFAAGLETGAGAAAAEYGRQEHVNNQLTGALAQATLYEQLGDIRQQLAHEIDPEKVNQHYSNARAQLDAVAQSIPDPTYRRLWTAQHSDDVSKVQLLARERQQAIFKDRALAGSQEKIDVLLRQAQQSSDPVLHQQANKGIGDIYTYLTEAGTITAAQAQGGAKKAHEALVSGHVHYLLANDLAPEADAYLDREKNVLDPKVLQPLKHQTKGLADQKIANEFGDAVSAGRRPGGPGQASLGADFAKSPEMPFGTPVEAGRRLTTVTAPGGASFQVHEKAAPQIQGFVNELEGLGYKINPETSGGYNNRNKVGVKTNEKSEHAFGSAIDINSDRNKQDTSLVTDLPPNVGEIAAKWGLKWGGTFEGTKDAMHFEVAQLGRGAGAQGSVSQRNIENNNPGNIKAPGGGYRSFATPEAGVEAISNWLVQHYDQGQTTIRQLIDKPKVGYASSEDPENAGKELPEKAAAIVGVSPDAPIDMRDPAMRQKMVQAILTQEGNAGFLTGQPRIPSLDEQIAQVESSDLPPDQKEIAIARVLRNDNRRRAIMRTEIARTKQLIADDAASTVTFGKIVPEVTRERVAAALGEEAADKFEDDRDTGLKFYEQTSDFDHLPPAELHRRLNIMAEAGGGRPGAEKQRKLYEMAVKKADALENERDKDPAAAVEKFPEVIAASQGANLNQPETYRPLVAARIQAMSQIDTPFDAMVPVTKSEATILYRPIAAAAASMDAHATQRALSRVIQTLQTGWGGYSDVALAEVLRVGHADLATREAAISAVKKLSEGQAPTSKESRAVDEAAKAGAIGAAVTGLTPQPERPTRTSFPAPDPDAITFLRQNPQTRAAFDENYGPGASEKIFAIAPPREPAQKPGERGRR